jgi:predicted GNAT family acetyltransferase
MADISVVDVPNEYRYEVRIGGQLVGLAEYVDHTSPTGERRIFTHTETDPSLQGKGIASTLIREALADTTQKGITIVPTCPFVVAWVRKHPEFDGEIDRPNGGDIAALRG